MAVIEIIGASSLVAAVSGVITITPELRSNSYAKKWYDLLVRKGIDATIRIYPDKSFDPDVNLTTLGYFNDYAVKIIPPYRNREGYKQAELITSGIGSSGIAYYKLRFDVVAGLKITIAGKEWTVIGYTEVKDNTGILMYLLQIESGD